MNQIALPVQDSVHCVGGVSADLAHPESICHRRYAANLHLARRQSNEEEHQEPLQPSPSPCFDGEEIGSHNQLPMPGEKLLPGRLTIPLWRRVDPASEVVSQTKLNEPGIAKRRIRRGDSPKRR